MIVYFQGNSLIVDEHVAEQLGLVEGSVIKTEEQFYEVIRMNASYNIVVLTQKLEDEITPEQ